MFAVIGGSGFIGKAIQEYVLRQRKQQYFVFTYNQHPEGVDTSLERIHVDLLDDSSTRTLEKFSAGIYVAGNSDHELARNDPLLDLGINVNAFLRLMKHYRGALVLLSSQAVYYGLEGPINEGVDHVSVVPYGASKQIVETYAKYFHREGRISRLWIFRLMYAFGKGERSGRLLPRCARATRLHDTVHISGKGESFLNPLPCWFVAKVLVTAAEAMQSMNEGFTETTNLNHSQKLTVAELVAFLSKVLHFDYELEDDTEEWPVRFWGETANLSAHLANWGVELPDLWANVREYFLELSASAVV